MLATRRPTPIARAMILAGLALPLVAGASSDASADEPSKPTERVANPAEGRFVDPTNAALLYARAWLLIPEETFKAVGEANPDRNPDWTPDAELSQKLVDAQSGVGTFLRAAKLDTADFGMEYSQGIGAMLPHLAKLRASARLLAADVRRLQAAGDTQGATDRVVAMFAMSRHCGRDGVLISSLVCVAMHALTANTTNWLLKTGSLTGAQRDAILAEMKKFNAADPFGIRNAVLGERQWTAVWIRNNFSGPDGAKKLIKELSGMEADANDAATQSNQLKIAAFNQAQLSLDLDRMVKFYDEAYRIYPELNAVELYDKLDTRVKAGEFGVIATVFAPAFGKSRQSDIRASAERTQLMNALTTYVPAK